MEPCGELWPITWRMILGKGIIGMSPPILMSTSQLHLSGSNAPQRRIANSTDHLPRPHYRSSLALSHPVKMVRLTLHAGLDWDRMG